MHRVSARQLDRGDTGADGRRRWRLRRVSGHVEADADRRGYVHKNTRIKLDGRHYINATFENVTFEWNGMPGGITGASTLQGYNRVETKSPVVSSAWELLNIMQMTTEEFRKSWQRLPDSYFKAFE